jgi:chorismate-pyruvate lyase
MNEPAHAEPDLQALFALFPPAEYIVSYKDVSATEVPEPYRRLLVHEHHMTVTVEAHHGSLVDVRVLEEHLDKDAYARKILLVTQTTGRVVQFGLMRVQFRFLSDKVRREILSRQVPLGRVLIQNNVLRRIEPTAFLRVIPGPAMMKWFGLDRPTPTYGRLAMIHCNDQPAVELVEIVAPEKVAG